MDMGVSIGFSWLRVWLQIAFTYLTPLQNIDISCTKKTKNSARRSSDSTLSQISPIYTVISYFFTIHCNVHLCVRVSNSLPFQLLNYNFVCNSHLSNSRAKKLDQVATLLYSGAIRLKRPRFLWASSVRRRIWLKWWRLFSARKCRTVPRDVTWSLPPAVFQTYRMQPHR